MFWILPLLIDLLVACKVASAPILGVPDSLGYSANRAFLSARKSYSRAISTWPVSDFNKRLPKLLPKMASAGIQVFSMAVR